MDDKDYIISRRFIYGLEFVRSEMELKLTEAKIKNVNFDSSDADKKIKAVADAQIYLNVLYDELVRIKRENYSLVKENERLVANEMRNI